MSQRPQHPRMSFAERDVETSELFRRLAATDTPEESEQVVEQIVHLYLDLCASMAGRYDGRGVEHEDLVQVARLALVKAVRRYEPGHAPSFAAYAVPTISGELKRWFRDRGWVVRPPRRLQELRANLQSVRSRLEQELGATPTDAELAEAVGATVEEVREVATAATGFRPLSLDCSPSDEDRPGLAAFLAADDDGLAGADDRVCLAEALTELDDDERELLLMRYVEGMTQREIGEARGVSQMQVSRTLRRITVRLHDQLTEHDPDSHEPPDVTDEMSTAS
ncbi:MULTISPECIES: sigma-70 family RNA polymerase sigma factor [unclassified Terrabacter]|uniref:sigma-70 family RNA polymerase sigma factor n=1 Tax=unclassified Terrabacter TaxID=2630222 RepID=UPI0009E6B68C|nr:MULTISPECIES: sigma-70 family RNA polymerase sigma factor [unclassified Terrabacter]